MTRHFDGEQLKINKLYICNVYAKITDNSADFNRHHRCSEIRGGSMVFAWIL